MRLLETESLKLVEFQADQIPRYAILSHTWGNEEVLFEHFQDGSFESKYAYKTKVKRACAQAREDGFKYIWIDTCNIDKRSSAELSEAINSMYAWYQNASICYAYLSDVHSPDYLDELASSRWFQRGWTLQELLAPSHLIFFTSEWRQIGTKTRLIKELAEITNINKRFLLGSIPLGSASVAMRMSWASSRKTTRPEDIAYCLMGLFSVNMPMLYGEGGIKAFQRLQEEIMKQSTDHSLFAWTDPSAPDDAHYGLLATSPSQFTLSRSVISHEGWEGMVPYAMTNMGVQIDLPLKKIGDSLFVATLACPAQDGSGAIGLYLKNLGNTGNEYVRVKASQTPVAPHTGNSQTLFVRQAFLWLVPQEDNTRQVIELRGGPKSTLYNLDKVYYPDALQGANSRLLVAQLIRPKWLKTYGVSYTIPKESNQVAVSMVFRSDDEQVVVRCGSASDFGVGFDAMVVANHEITSVWLNEVCQFRPKKPGSTISVRGRYLVRVGFTPQLERLTKRYFVDITIVTPGKAR